MFQRFLFCSKRGIFFFSISLSSFRPILDNIYSFSIYLLSTCSVPAFHINVDCICFKYVGKYMDMKKVGLESGEQSGRKPAVSIMPHLLLCSSFSEPSCYLKQNSSSLELTRSLSLYINIPSPSISSRFGISLNSVHQKTILADGNNISGRDKK